MNGKGTAQGEVRSPLELLPYGLLIAAGMEGKKPVGIVLTWAMQVSFDPPLVAAAFERSSRLRVAIALSRRFTLSFLPRRGGTSLARKFLQSSRSEGLSADAIALTESGLPYAAGAVSWLECTVRQEIPTGDHDTVIAEVIESWERTEGAGEVLRLKDTGWRYRR